MAERELPQYRLTAGEMLVRAMDSAGLAPVVAAWFYDHSREEWRLLLQFAPGLAKREALLRIADVLAEHREIWSGASMGDITVASEDDDVAAAIATVVHTGRGISALPFGPCYANGIYISSGWAYRVVSTEIAPRPTSAATIS